MNLQLADYLALSPFLILLAGCLSLLIIEIISDRLAFRFSFFIAIVFFAGAFLSIAFSFQSLHPLLTRWLLFDPLSRIFALFFIAVGLGSAFLSRTFFQRFNASHDAYYFLLMASILGLLLIAYAADFLTLFLGIETLSISLYVSCGYMKHWEISKEASIKYFITGAIATSFFLYGIALIYGAFGTTQFQAMTGFGEANQTLFYSGIALVTVGLCFKGAIFPFHIWAPDVYAGAPTPVTAFMTVGTKAGAFAAFVRIFSNTLGAFNPIWNQVIAILAVMTLIFANIVMVRQTNLRRFFAYSGISHAGYLLFPIIAQTPQSESSLLFYLIVYAFAIFGAFAVISFLDGHTQGVMIQDLTGFFYRSPFFASILALFLMTLAGVPPTAGFFAKFSIFAAAFEAGYYPLVIIGLITAILSSFYYFRILSQMFTEEPVPVAIKETLSSSFIGVLAFIALLYLTFFPGVFL